MFVLPPSARLAWWGTAWLRGAVGPDDLLEAVLGEDVAHVVVGAEGGVVGLVVEARSAGATSIGAAFPAPGHPVGLAGGGAFTAAAIEAGEGVVAGEAGLGWVPTQVGPTVEWRAFAAARRPLPDVAEADRALRAEVLAAGDTLARLDVARWRPEVADLLMAPGLRAVPSAPGGTPPRCVELASRALWAWEVAALALDGDGGAVSASEADARRQALVPLERAARSALTAACSPEVWPPA